MLRTRTYGAELTLCEWRFAYASKLARYAITLTPFSTISHWPHQRTSEDVLFSCDSGLDCVGCKASHTAHRVCPTHTPCIVTLHLRSKLLHYAIMGTPCPTSTHWPHQRTSEDGLFFMQLLSLIQTSLNLI